MVEVWDEEADLRERYWHPLKGETVLDIGCFRGSYTLPALRAGAHVHAIDANGRVLDVLRANAHDIDERLSTAIWCMSDGNLYPDELLALIAEPMRPPVGCPTYTIDDYVGVHGLHVDWIKIDIEGGELAALHGATDTLRNQRPRLIVEEHELVYPDVLQGNLARTLAFLWDCNYTVDVVPLVGHERRPVHLIAVPA